MLFMLMTVAFGWTLSLTRSDRWGADFSHYYVASQYLADDFRLYMEVHDHKGPAFYLFLHLIGKIIGYGVFQAILSIFITAFLYLTTLFYIGTRFIQSKTALFIVSLALGATLIGQPGGTGISQIQSIFLLNYFYFLYKNLTTEETKYLYLSILFWSLAVLTRIDGFFYAILFPFILYKRNIGSLIKLLPEFIGIPLITAYLFSWYLDYSLLQYFKHIILINIIYKTQQFSEFKDLFFRDMSFYLFAASGISLVLQMVFCNKSIFQKSRFSFFLTSVLLSSLVLYIFSGSARIQHLPIVYPGILFFIIVTIANIDIELPAVILAIFFLAYSNFINVAPGIYHNLIDLQNDKLFELNNEDDRLLVEEIATFEEEEIYGIFYNFWIYVLSQKKPAFKMSGGVFYLKPFYHFSKLKDLDFEKPHKNLLSGEKRFILDSRWRKEATDLLKDLIGNSKLVKRIGIYEIRQIGI